MSREQKIKQAQISIFGEIAKECKTDHQKIEFFDSSKEAFFTDSNESTTCPCFTLGQVIWSCCAII